MQRIGIINGPNLNLTGKREQDIYGKIDFSQIVNNLQEEFSSLEILYFQSNIEGEIINCLQEWGFTLDGIILNAGAYTHTSVAIGDTIKSISTPVVEVHLSNVLGREEFRHVSYIAPHAKGIISGFGAGSYRLALRSFLQ
jgi:3-dehydroquinate dehydratase-2